MLVLDMVGFSRLTLEHGIIHYLAMNHQMVEAATPAVNANGGRVIKQDADNIFAIFDNPTRALEAARDILRAFDAVNTVTPIERHLHGSVGIGYGQTLVIDDSDLFGPEMNLASKLGEDLAGENKILLTASAYEALPAGRYVFAPLRFSIGGMEIDCFRYERALFESSRGDHGIGQIKTDAMD
jgi:class 3 adenylate cyclase